jgi:hypothetical protein
MNLLIKKISFLIFIPVMLLQSYSQDCKGTLIINTDREESIIYLNNEKIGEGNIQLELHAGLYTVYVKENNNLWENKHLSSSIKIEECNHQTLTFNFDDDVYLQTIPADAGVFKNDSLIGYTPLHLANNYGSLQLKKPGYKNKFITLEEYENNPVKVGVLDYMGKIKETSFYEKDLFKILLAGIVVLGGTTAYFKLKADEKFEEYEITGDQALLDQTERYDLISGITFTALQINFGALIFFFLND